MKQPIQKTGTQVTGRVIAQDWELLQLYVDSKYQNSREQLFLQLENTAVIHRLINGDASLQPDEIKFYLEKLDSRDPLIISIFKQLISKLNHERVSCHDLAMLISCISDDAFTAVIQHKETQSLIPSLMKFLASLFEFTSFVSKLTVPKQIALLDKIADQSLENFIKILVSDGIFSSAIVNASAWNQMQTLIKKAAYKLLTEKEFSREKSQISFGDLCRLFAYLDSETFRQVLPTINFEPFRRRITIRDLICAPLDDQDWRLLLSHSSKLIHAIIYPELFYDICHAQLGERLKERLITFAETFASSAASRIRNSRDIYLIFESGRLAESVLTESCLAIIRQQITDFDEEDSKRENNRKKAMLEYQYYWEHYDKDAETQYELEQVFQGCLAFSSVSQRRDLSGADVIMGALKRILSNRVWKLIAAIDFEDYWRKDTPHNKKDYHPLAQLSKLVVNNSNPMALIDALRSEVEKLKAARFTFRCWGLIFEQLKGEEAQNEFLGFLTREIGLLITAPEECRYSSGDFVVSGTNTYLVKTRDFFTYVLPAVQEDFLKNTKWVEIIKSVGDLVWAVNNFSSAHIIRILDNLIENLALTPLISNWFRQFNTNTVQNFLEFTPTESKTLNPLIRKYDYKVAVVVVRALGECELALSGLGGHRGFLEALTYISGEVDGRVRRARWSISAGNEVKSAFFEGVETRLTDWILDPKNAGLVGQLEHHSEYMTPQQKWAVAYVNALNSLETVSKKVWQETYPKQSFFSSCCHTRTRDEESDREFYERLMEKIKNSDISARDCMLQEIHKYQRSSSFVDRLKERLSLKVIFSGEMQSTPVKVLNPLYQLV